MIVNHSFSTVISQLSFIIYQLSTNMKDLITGAEALMRSLEHQGVTTIFGYPGGSIMPVFDALYDHQNILNHILVRHILYAENLKRGFFSYR